MKLCFRRKKSNFMYWILYDVWFIYTYGFTDLWHCKNHITFNGRIAAFNSITLFIYLDIRCCCCCMTFILICWQVSWEANGIFIVDKRCWRWNIHCTTKIERKEQHFPIFTKSLLRFIHCKILPTSCQSLFSHMSIS